MPYIEINGANIYYNAYGDDKPGRAPILLIHGSMIDSHTDWDSIAPELAREYKVFTPDCRGHGRSNNPRMSYSFRELADDATTFVDAREDRPQCPFGAARGVACKGFGFFEKTWMMLW